jgi:hypothetical protein
MKIVNMGRKSHPVFILSLGLLSPPIPSFRGIRKVKIFLLNHSTKYCNSVQIAAIQHLMHKVRE